ncbi:hypothetical protein [Mangrovibacillus cuniculi]|uniref:Uncharacterized protein n=1 Tax=Mangrovibacillus cuniculi TaxID=2593652 RepID=A0A7S8HE99_9BACI|nr:hypothetical protein [Mangrovibacillus cuniculi]QPC45619.1 hypothetical protein G8O30_00815 [Mangrovibacillus cuniculi]
MYVKKNLLLFPLHGFLYLCLFISILLAGEKDGYLFSVSAVIAQTYIIGLLPTIYLLIKNRKKPLDKWDLANTLLLLFLPYVIIATFMYILYL